MVLVEGWCWAGMIGSNDDACGEMLFRHGIKGQSMSSMFYVHLDLNSCFLILDVLIANLIPVYISPYVQG